MCGIGGGGGWWPTPNGDDADVVAMLEFSSILRKDGGDDEGELCEPDKEE